VAWRGVVWVVGGSGVGPRPSPLAPCPPPPPPPRPFLGFAHPPSVSSLLACRHSAASFLAAVLHSSEPLVRLFKSRGKVRETVEEGKKGAEKEGWAMGMGALIAAAEAAGYWRGAFCCHGSSDTVPLTLLSKREQADEGWVGLGGGGVGNQKGRALVWRRRCAAAPYPPRPFPLPDRCAACVRAVGRRGEASGG
jgi:hypothetical protein